MQIPFDALSKDALAGVIEEYVTRDGTELTEATDKIAAVRDALRRRELVIVFDAESESCNILAAEEARERQRDLERAQATAEEADGA